MRFRPTRAIVLGQLCTVLLATIACASASSQPMVRIRAESRLTAGVQTVGAGKHLRGALHDDLDQPLPNRRIVVSLTRRGQATEELELVTDGSGRFDARLGDLRGVDVEVSFAGDALHTSSRADGNRETGQLDVDFEWGIAAGAVFDLALPAHEIEVGLFPATNAQGRRLTLSSDFGPLDVAVTDAAGRARFSFPSSRLGDARRADLIAESEATATQPAMRELRTVIVRGPSSLSLEATPTGAPAELHVSGTLLTGGRPLPRRAITVTAGEVRLATLQTDAEGRFDETLQITAAVASIGELAVRARFDSDAPWHAATRSAVVRVSMPPSLGPHPAWLGVVALLCLLALWRLRAPPTDITDTVSAPTKARSRSGFRPPAGQRLSWGGELRIGGRVLDVERQGGIAHATLRLIEGPGAPIEIEVDAQGDFTSPELAPGSYRISASAPEYCEEQAELRVPHRGQFTNMQVALERLRNRAFEQYRPLADALGPGVGAGALLTPREIVDSRVRAGKGSTELDVLTGLVELAVYGPELPDEGNIAEIRRKAAALQPDGEATGGDGGRGGQKRATIPHQR